MTAYRDILWLLLGDWIYYTENRCLETDSQLIFIREMFLDYILLEVHYTSNSSFILLMTLMSFLIWKIHYHQNNKTIRQNQLYHLDFLIYDDVVCYSHE